jgi:hypothetical protein
MSYTSYGTELFGGTTGQDTYREAFREAQAYRTMLKKAGKDVVSLKQALDHVGYVKMDKKLSKRRLAEIERSKKTKITLKEPFEFTRAQRIRHRENEDHYKLERDDREKIFDEQAKFNKVGHHIRRHQKLLENVGYSDAHIKKFKRIAAKLARGEKISKKSREYHDAVRDHFHQLGGAETEDMPLIGLSYMPDHAMLGSAEIYGAAYMPRRATRRATRRVHHRKPRRHHMGGTELFGSAEIYGAEIYGAEHMPRRATRVHHRRPRRHLMGAAEIYGAEIFG